MQNHDCTVPPLWIYCFGYIEASTSIAEMLINAPAHIYATNSLHFKDDKEMLKGGMCRALFACKLKTCAPSPHTISNKCQETNSYNVEWCFYI